MDRNVFKLKDDLQTATLLGDHSEIDRLKEEIRMQEEAEDMAYMLKRAEK